MQKYLDNQKEHLNGILELMQLLSQLELVDHRLKISFLWKELFLKNSLIRFPLLVCFAVPEWLLFLLW